MIPNLFLPKFNYLGPGGIVNFTPKKAYFDIFRYKEFQPSITTEIDFQCM